MLEKKVESNPPFNPTQWAWWLVTVGVREMREVDGFYPHDQSYPPAVPNLPSHRLTPTVPSTLLFCLTHGSNLITCQRSQLYLLIHISEFHNVRDIGDF